MSQNKATEWRKRVRRIRWPRFGNAPASGVSRRFTLIHAAGLMTAALFCLAGFGSIALSAVFSAAQPVAANARPIAAGPPPVPPAAWIEIKKPLEIFSLEAPDLANAVKTYTATRHRGGGGRRDVLALGTLGGAPPAIRLALYRRGAEDYVRAPLFADIARQAADAGLSVTRSGLPAILPTRFGRFEIAEIALGRASPPGGSTAAGLGARLVGYRAGAGAAKRPAEICGGFRLIADKPAFTISGIACGTAIVTPRRHLACLLDRLDLAAGGGDRPLADFFAASELKRDRDCEGMRLAPDLVHAAWLDDHRATPAKKSRRH